MSDAKDDGARALMMSCTIRDETHHCGDLNALDASMGIGDVTYLLQLQVLRYTQHMMSLMRVVHCTYTLDKS